MKATFVPDKPHNPNNDSAKRFREVRRAHSTETREDYVEAVAAIIDRAGECRVKDLADEFGVSHVTVTKVVARLVEEGLAETEPYRPVSLTSKGRKLARECHDRHELVLRFLRFLGVSEEVAQIDSEGIEHHVSAETLHRIRAFLDQQDPT